ncbi:hypothetical protein BC361_07885 [Ensifer sp. LC54]|nr:hypothetical protein BC361_07885 [Ensifer sp. LC54]OCP28916.1 hypothetical protein BC363_02475 [Ensifer sp. LC384]
MTVLPLSDVFDLLPIASVVWDRDDNTETSGMGSGAFWEADLAPSLWTGDVSFDRDRTTSLKQVAALVRWLRATKQRFMMCDPVSLYPAEDPGGAILGNAEVTLRAITNRFVAPLQGLPVGYVLTPGDKLQVPYADKHAFVEVAQRAVADAAGRADIAISPHLPLPIVDGAAVNLKRPAFVAAVAPKSHNPGTARRHLTEGAGFKVIEKRN